MLRKVNWKKQIVLFGLLFLLPVSLYWFLGISAKHHFETLPYKGEQQITGSDTSQYTLPAFSFLNHRGQRITNDSLKGKIWLAAFYSTGHPLIASITNQLLPVNFKYRYEPGVKFVIFSTDPQQDTPEAMSDYVDRITKGYDPLEKWQFLSGRKTQVDSLMRFGFMIEKPDNTARVFLVDEEGHIRGSYSGNNDKELRHAVEDIGYLKKETDRRKKTENEN
ncbi:MAG: SCO family protein [Flavobacteriales bacterium]|nr:SCO family protein [Flavobacteriales bacterium]